MDTGLWSAISRLIGGDGWIAFGGQHID